MFKEFREFIAHGNVLDLAVGVIIGAAFGKIVSALVDNILMPVIGLVTGGVNFNDLALTLKPAQMADGKVVAEAVLLKYGSFIQSIIDFLILAFVVFLIVRAYNKMTKKQAVEAAPPAPSTSEVLLGEIRDLLKK